MSAEITVIEVFDRHTPFLDSLGLVNRLRAWNDTGNVRVFVPRLPGRGILAVQFPLFPFDGLAALPILACLFLVALCKSRSHPV